MAEVVLYADSRGDEPVYDYKGERLQDPFASAIDKKERIFELRPGNHRVAYALHQGTYVLLHAWRKQAQKLDEREAGKARRRLADWRRRHP